MPDLLYVSLMRTPTEKAHGLQIVQNCEAFVAAGYRVTLWGMRRWNTPEMRQVTDIHAYYGVDKTFDIQRLPVIDLMPLAFGQPLLERVAFYVQIITYVIVMFMRLLFERADVYYTRDEYLLLALSLFIPRHKLAYEAHLFATTRQGARLQRWTCQRAGHVIGITPPMADDLIRERGAEPDSVHVAHDGVRAQRFEHLPDRDTARDQIGWPQDALIVGFVGRLHMLNVDKGVGALVSALIDIPQASLAIVGGPDDMAQALRDRWLAAGRSADSFLYAGHVAPADVPRYLAAFDICAMPHPFTRQFAYYTSPLKLFEYMAAGRAIVASDLPAWADVITDGQIALLVPPDDVPALADAIRRLCENAVLRDQLGKNAREHALRNYTWSARAKAIRAHIERAG